MLNTGNKNKQTDNSSILKNRWYPCWNFYIRENMKKTALIFNFFVLISSFSMALPPPDMMKSTAGKPSNVGQPKSAGCIPAAQRFIMDFNDVSAMLEIGGLLFMDRTQPNRAAATYEVPKGGGVTAIYAASLWMGGYDVNGQLKVAAVTFRNSGDDFWGGPLTVNSQTADANYDPSAPVGDGTIRTYGAAEISPDVCAAYDRFFPINKMLVIRFIQWWRACIDPNALAGECELIEEDGLLTNAEMATLREWPAHGDVSLDQDYYLAPFYDNNQDGVYNIEDGDYPWYDDILGKDDVECGIDRRVTLFGDQTLWFIFNDKGNVHTESSGQPIGMEIRGQAFVFATADEINRMTFYNYELINRSTQTLTNTYFAQYLDVDLGNAEDDFIGCDVSRGLGYVYNGDDDDETNAGRPGYGLNPPSVGVDFFEGPYQDNDGLDNPLGIYFNETLGKLDTMNIQDVLDQKGIMYKGIGTGYGDGIIDNERLGMRLFTYYNNAAGPYGDPSNAVGFYNYMSGFWGGPGGGFPITYGGAGYSTSSGGTDVPTTYVFPGDSDPFNWALGGDAPPFSDPWTETQAGNSAGDRRFVQSAGPFTLKPGATNNITVGIVYGRALSGGAVASVEVMKLADTKAQALFDACFKILDPPMAPRLTIQELENELILMIDNPSTSNNRNEMYEEEDNINIPDNYPSDAKKYHFEGYQIFQLVDDAASVADIGDVSKVRQVAQCDIVNDVATLYNFEMNEAWGILEGKQMVVGANEGIRHTFQITTDAFALGANPRLVNHKRYYFVAVAYAFNEYKKFDQNDPLFLDGQKIPYIVSRLGYDGTSIRAVEGVPHNPRPELGGTQQVVNYGSTPRVTRIDGHGNGNNALELTAQSREQIVRNGKLERVEYENGGAPIGIKVIDPLNVADGYFELEFKDYVPTNISGQDNNSADTANWVIYRYDRPGGNILDSVTSDMRLGKVLSVNVMNYVYQASNNEQIIPAWGISVQIHQKKYERQTNTLATQFTNPISATITFSDTTKQWLSLIGDVDGASPLNWIRSGRVDPASSTDLGPDIAPWFNPINFGDARTEGGGFVDPDGVYERLLGGGIAPHSVVGFETDFMPLAYSPNSLPVDKRDTRRNYSTSYLPSVDIVLTSDRSKWTRVPVIEMGRNSLLNENGAKAGELRKSPSRDKNGMPDATGMGMSWFPGYAVDLETGVRLHMAFGENSALTQSGGRDMVWNPAPNITDNAGNYIMGGVQPIWVFGANTRMINGGNLSAVDNLPPYDPNIETVYNALENSLRAIETGPPTERGPNSRIVYTNLAWIVYPYLTPGQQLNSTDVIIRARINKVYKNYTASGENNGFPKYSWSMNNLATQRNREDVLSSVLDMINVVPNPYLAYSQYERSRLDTRIKITNLPDQCLVRIYSSNGKLIRSFKKDSPITSIDWDLTNSQRVPVASGVYLIHVEVPNVGERVLKSFIGVRQVDLQGL